MISVKGTIKGEIIYTQFVSWLRKQAFVFGNLRALLPMRPQPWPVRKMGFLHAAHSHPPQKIMIPQQSFVLYIRMHCADVTDIIAKIVNSVHARSL